MSGDLHTVGLLGTGSEVNSPPTLIFFLQEEERLKGKRLSLRIKKKFSPEQKIYLFLLSVSLLPFKKVFLLCAPETHLNVLSLLHHERNGKVDVSLFCIEMDGGMTE
jgi:hypothetical protein